MKNPISKSKQPPAKTSSKRKQPPVKTSSKNQIASNDEEQSGNILSELPPDTKPEIVGISQSYSGPLPSPDMFKKYEQILPGAANRIMVMAETEQEIRKRDNGWGLRNDSVRVRGSVVVSLALVGAGVICAYIGQPWLGGVLGTSGAVAAIIKYIIEYIIKRN